MQTKVKPEFKLPPSNYLLCMEREGRGCMYVYPHGPNNNNYVNTNEKQMHIGTLWWKHARMH